jgi:hypothetical protein
VAQFLRQCEDFAAEGRSYRREGISIVEGTIFKVLIFNKAVQLYGLWHEFLDNRLRDNFVFVSDSLGCQMYYCCYL